VKKTRDELKSLRQFGTSLAAILVILGAINFLKGRMGWYPWFFGLSFIVILLVLISPKSLRPIHIVFTKIAHAIGWFNTRAVLIIIYYILVTPTAIIMKIFGKDPLNRKICKNESSYWVKRQTIKSTKDQLEKQF